MEIPKFIKGVAKYFTYASDSGETTPTTQADLQELMKNNNTILECLVDGLWQPEKEMKLNQIVRSPNMPANTVAKVTSVGVTGTTEPEWPETVDATVSDGSVTFTMESQQANIKKNIIVDLIYPVGSIYTSVNSTSPADLFGGTWEAMPAGRVLLAQGTSEWGVEYKAGSTGGEHEHQLSVVELPKFTPTGSMTNVPLTGTFTINNSNTGGFEISTSGIISKIGIQSRPISGGGSNWYELANGFAIDATHAHKLTFKSIGSDSAHNIMQPYLSVFMWKRTA